jgi:uncharacterized membrane protein YfhO
LGILLIFVLITIEFSYLSSITVNNRKFLASEKLKEKAGFNDYTIEAVRFIKNIDNSFYRINKDFHSNYTEHLGLNDAQYQQYYGTSNYHSFNQKYYIRFLDAFEVIDAKKENQSRWAMGLGNTPILQTFASIKYSLSKSEAPFHLKFYYKQIGKTGDVKILQNNNYLPLGFTYDTYITRSVFESFKLLQKYFLVFKAFIINDEDTGNFQGYSSFAVKDSTTDLSFNEFIRITNILKQDTLNITSFSENKIEGTIELEKEKLLFFSIPFDDGWRAYVNGQEKELKLVNIGFMGLMLDEGQHHIVLSYTSPFVTAGAIISLIMIFVTVLLLFFEKKTKRKFINQGSI